MKQGRFSSDDQVVLFVRDAQVAMCDAFQRLEPSATFAVDDWESALGFGSTRIIAGEVFEKGGVNTSMVAGGDLPPSVLTQRPELAGQAFLAAGISVVMHPRN
ncbi:MAG TPA: coproporphyrinogen III oxidase, partial [Candidatus Tumulicola sp.]